MSEESLLADAESTPNEESQESQESTWSYAEGIGGEGDAPEWLKTDKFKSVADQAAAYKGLEGKLGGFTGAPEEYDVSMPDGVEGDFIEGDPLMASFQDWAKENQLSQEAFTGLLHMYVKNENEANGINRETELGALGDNGKQRLQNISDFGRANLSEEDYTGLLDATATAASIQAVEALIAMTRAPKIPTDDSEVNIGISHADLKERMADPRYQTSPEFRKETSKLYEQVFGGAPHKNVVG